MAHNIRASSASEIAIRVTLSGSEPMRLDATSAKRAVTVHEQATPKEISSPTYIVLLMGIDKCELLISDFVPIDIIIFDNGIIGSFAA